LKTGSLKRWIKYVLIISGSVVLLSLVIVIVGLLVCGDNDYRDLAVWGVQHAAGCRMIVDGPFTVDLSAEPSVTADRIRFEAVPGGAAPDLKSIGHFHLKIALKPLLLGTFVVKQLQIADAVIEEVNLQQKQGNESQPTQKLPHIIIPILESVSLKNIRLADSGRNLRVQLNQLTMDDVQDTGPLYVKGDGSVNGTQFQIDGRLGALKELFDLRQPYPLALHLKAADLTLSVGGTVADFENGEGLNLQLSAADQNMAELLKIFQVDYPSPGHLNFKAALSGDLAAPRVSDLHLIISGDPSVEISAEGAIADLRDGEGTDILLAILCRNEDLLRKIFPADLKVVKEFKFNGVLRKTPAGFGLEDITARMVNDKGIDLQAGGRLGLGSIREHLAVKEMNLELHLTTPSTASIRPLLTDSIPEIGSVDFRGRLTGPVEHPALEDLVIIRGGTGPVRVETRGRIGWVPLEGDQPLKDMDLAVSILSEQSSILSTFYGVPIKEIGTVALTGRVTGDADRFQLKDIEFHSKDARGLETRLSGGIDFAEQADGEVLGNVNINLDINAPDMAAAEPLLGANLVPTLGPVYAKGLVLGTTDVLSIENIDVAAGKPDKLQVKWQGRIGKLPLGGDRPISDVHTYGSLQAARSSDFTALIGIKLPDIGPVHASWRETDRNGIYGVDDVKFVAGDGKTFKLRATGSVASVIQHKQAVFDGVDLKLGLTASGTQTIFKIFGVRLPDLGAVDGRLALTGGGEKLKARDLKLSVKSPKGLEIAATGGVGYIGLEKELPMRDIDVRLTAQAPDLAALPLDIGRRLPDLGQLQATARIRGRDRSVNVEPFEILAGPRSTPLLQLQGRIENIGRREQIKLLAGFKAGSRPWLEKFIRLKSAASPQFEGIINLSGVSAGAAEQIRIDRFELSSADLGGLSVFADGDVKSGADSPDFELHVTSQVQDPGAWSAIFDMALPRMSPLTIDGRCSGSQHERIFDGETRLGDTRFQTLVRQLVDRPWLPLAAKLSSGIVHLNDLGFYPGGEEKKSAAAQTAPTSKSASLFDDRPLPLDNLKFHDFSLNLSADQVVGQGVELGHVDIDLTSNNGRLRIGTSEIKYRLGHLSFESILDTAGTEPAVALKIAAEDMDLDEVLLYLHEPPMVEGQLSLAADLQSRGRSIRELAANLSGEFGAAIEHGRIQRGVEMVASDALDLLFTAPAKGTFTDLNCLAGRLDFKNGDGSIQILYLDTPGVRARAYGSINLASEKVDILIKPESKRRFFGRASPVRIKGPLNDPSVSKLPANEAAILAAQLAVPMIALPARALGLLWSLIRGDKDENSPCLTGGALPDIK
jgi:uncharacterized protein involved in outer membrane biogenesis